MPVVAIQKSKVDDRSMQIAVPCTDSDVETVPGIWDTNSDTGIVCVMGTDEFDVTLEPGSKVGEVHTASVQTRMCQSCGCQDTDAWIENSKMKKCDDCGTILCGGQSACRQCGEKEDACCVLSYAGCSSCRPEKKLEGRVRRGPATNALARSALAFAALCSAVDPVSGYQGGVAPAGARSEARPGRLRGADSGPTMRDDGRFYKTEAIDCALHPVFHIIEEPGGIKYLTECEVPTEAYNSARTADLRARYPKATPAVIEHLDALEAFLDTSIMAGFSYGINKAFIMVTEGSLLGHKVDRYGSSHEGERIQAIQEFAPLKDVTQVRQFVGSTNWVKRYLLPHYATAVKILGEYMKLSLIHI